MRGKCAQIDFEIEAMSEARTFFGRRKKTEQQDAAGKRLQRLIADDVVRIIEEDEPPLPESKEDGGAQENISPDRQAESEWSIDHEAPPQVPDPTATIEQDHSGTATGDPEAVNGRDAFPGSAPEVEAEAVGDELLNGTQDLNGTQEEWEAETERGLATAEAEWKEKSDKRLIAAEADWQGEEATTLAAA